MADISTNISNLVTDLRNFRNKLTGAGIEVGATAGFRECVDKLEFPETNLCNHISTDTFIHKLSYVSSNTLASSGTSNQFGYLNLSTSSIPSEYSRYNYYHSCSGVVDADQGLYVPIEFAADFELNTLYHYENSEGSSIQLYRKTVVEWLYETIEEEEILCDENDDGYRYHWFSFSQGTVGVIMRVWGSKWDGRQYVWTSKYIEPKRVQSNIDGDYTCTYYGNIRAHAVKVDTSSPTICLTGLSLKKHSITDTMTPSVATTSINCQIINTRKPLKTVGTNVILACGWYPHNHSGEVTHTLYFLDEEYRQGAELFINN